MDANFPQFSSAEDAVASVAKDMRANLLSVFDSLTDIEDWLSDSASPEHRVSVVGMQLTLLHGHVALLKEAIELVAMYVEATANGE